MAAAGLDLTTSPSLPHQHGGIHEAQQVALSLF